MNWEGNLDESDESEIRALLLGRTVTKVDGDSLLLDDGTTMTIHPNEGCGGCSAGWYNLTELNECPVNAIMAVEFNNGESPGEDFGWGATEQYSYRVFVLAADRRIKLWQVDGDDGNGCYGTGYWIEIAARTDSQPG
jgi:hypothetical protein